MYQINKKLSVFVRNLWIFAQVIVLSACCGTDNCYFQNLLAPEAIGDCDYVIYHVDKNGNLYRQCISSQSDDRSSLDVALQKTNSKKDDYDTFADLDLSDDESDYIQDCSEKTTEYYSNDESTDVQISDQSFNDLHYLSEISNQKFGVYLDGLDPEMVETAIFAVKVFKDVVGKNYTPTITSTTEGEHMYGSKHYMGRAVDFRTKDIDDDILDDVYASIYSNLSNAKVLLEDRYTSNSHFHIQLLNR